MIFSIKYVFYIHGPKTTSLEEIMKSSDKTTPPNFKYESYKGRPILDVYFCNFNGGITINNISQNGKEILAKLHLYK